MIPINTSVVSGVVLSMFSNKYRMLLLKRTGEGYWCHVAGKIENGELAWEAMVRELREETNIEAKDLYNGEYQQQFYDPSHNQIMLITCFAIYCEPEQIVHLNEEHTDYKWCDLEEAKTLVPFPNQKKLYDHIWLNFVESRPPDHLKINVC